MLPTASPDPWRCRGRNALALARQATLLRPQLVCLGYAAAQGSEAVLTQPNVGLEKFAAGVEMQHLFMLIHECGCRVFSPPPFPNRAAAPRARARACQGSQTPAVCASQ